MAESVIVRAPSATSAVRSCVCHSARMSARLSETLTTAGGGAPSV